MNRRELLGGGAASVAALMIPVPKALPALPAPVVEPEVVEGEVVDNSDQAYYTSLAMVFAFYVDAVNANSGKFWRVAASSEHPVPSHPQHQDDQHNHQQDVQEVVPSK